MTAVPGTREFLGSDEVVRHARITYRRLDYLARRGLVHHEPLPEGRPGHGFSRRWPRAEADVAQAIGRLTAAGFELEAAARIARQTEPRTKIAPGVWLELGPALSDPCERGDCEGCFPEEPSDCGHGCHGEQP
jgi:hypothetical protein